MTQIHLTPLADRVVVSLVTKPLSPSGIIITETVETEHPEQGTVLAIGKGCKEVAVGDVVVFTKYGPETVTLEGVNYYILREDQILAIVK